MMSNTRQRGVVGILAFAVSFVAFGNLLIGVPKTQMFASRAASEYR
jgi:hypothetical protein